MTSFLLQGWQGSFFQWDDWSRLFVSLILGIGILVALHAWGYFKNAQDRFKFFATFFPFAIAMIGVVVSDSFLLFFISWELTSLLSYFLVSFKGQDPDARRGGQQALLITGMGGLSLLAGLVLLGSSAGIWTLSEATRIDLGSLPAGPWIAGLILLGILTKSAQFPFHFWLPGAMTAPTPASAYLHSATMVKAGIYLLYRLWPMLETLPWVSNLILILGFLTFCWGVILSLLQLDLKGVLAGTTLAHLGLMATMIAWKTQDLTEALFALVLAHAIYKAGLFLFSGVVEKLAGTRRIDLMSGLRRTRPFVFAVGLILAGASLGIPGTLAYHAKSLLHLPWTWKIALTLGFLILGKAGMLVAVRPFLGTPPEQTPSPDPASLRWMIFPPILLGVFSWFIAPFLLIGEKSPFGLVSGMDWSLKSVALSLVTALTAVALLQKWTPGWSISLHRIPWPQGASLFDRIWYAHLDLAKVLRDSFYTGSLGGAILSLFVVFVTGAGILFFQTDIVSVLSAARLPVWSDFFVWVCGAKILSVLFIVRTEKPILSVLYLGLTGYLFALTLALAGAPDLAMTQFAVESLSLLVLLYAVKGVGISSPRAKSFQFASVLISLMAGFAVAAITGLAALTRNPSRLRDFFGEQSFAEAHGRNVVNVILVDFRGFDTMGEITVLAIVALGLYLLLSALRGGKQT